MVAAKEKKRGKVNRLRTKFVVIGAEGKNKTERIYFNEFLKNNKNYKTKFLRGQETDPLGIVEATIKFSEDIGVTDEDSVYWFIDTDTDPSKQQQIDMAINLARKYNIEVISSNPLFEIWYLQHFRFSTGAYVNNTDVITELKRYIPEYEKNLNVYHRILANQDDAVQRAKNLERYHDGMGNIKEISRNPSSKVYQIIEKFK